MTETRTAPRREWMIAAGLILLALVPSIAGGVRLGEIASGPPPTPENARFLQAPLPVALHVVGALVFALVGAFQFLPELRRRHLAWHRFAGRYLVVPAGVVVAVSGLWMTASYDLPPVDGAALAISRYLVGLAMLVFLVLAVTSVARRDIAAHRAWMIRAYALAMGAGTQVLTAGPSMLVFGEPDGMRRLIEMDAGWLINIVVAEWVIARGRTSTRRRRRPAEAPV
ncbi:DUF2306 domain-containing protein [Aeromicrobium phragmitis]|uniref:DUF2306 domain-containing protein n=1 Tax=Aeromicrobium phragmitis TaxID=2478914 RepID=A0A3L8PJN9_9ACTN|nr:DUF2306 domain-containing protein [Aeromicrobium phragmitis]RLV54989.1 DUF2306 domain-containing protein [Aeromicrobium phragmitis]